MANPLSGHPAWRQVTIVAVVVPLLAVAAVLAFAWPAARLAPRDLPVGVVGTGAATQQVLAALDRSAPGAFDFQLYADQAAARSGIEHREVFGAFAAAVSPAVTAGGRSTERIDVLEAGAAGPVVAQTLTKAAQRVAAHGDGAGGPVTTRVVDVVPLSADDPRGSVFSASLLPLIICSIAAAAVIGLLVRFRPAWRVLTALAAVSAVAGLGVYLVAQGWLGALPNDGFATWAGLALIVFAIGSSAVGALALAGSAAFGVTAAVMVFLGNAFSGVTSAPELLPGAVAGIGRWLPPGAGASLLRDTAYFDGHGASPHLVVLITWAFLGCAAIVLGHHGPFRFAAAARRASVEPEPIADEQPRHLSPERVLAESVPS